MEKQKETGLKPEGKETLRLVMDQHRQNQDCQMDRNLEVGRTSSLNVGLLKKCMALWLTRREFNQTGKERRYFFGTATPHK